MEIKVTDMRAAGKPGYVAKIANNEKQFLGVKEYSGHGSSAKQLLYELTEDGIYEVCDANFGGRQRRIKFIEFAGGKILNESDNLSDLVLESFEIELPELEGSQKQIDWAENIRSKFVAKLKLSNQEIPSFVSSNIFAKYWIDNRSRFS